MCVCIIFKCSLVLLIFYIFYDVRDGGGDVAEVPLSDCPQVDPAARCQDVHVVAVGQGLALCLCQVRVVEHADLGPNLIERNWLEF